MSRLSSFALHEVKDSGVFFFLFFCCRDVIRVHDNNDDEVSTWLRSPRFDRVVKKPEKVIEFKKILCSRPLNISRFLKCQFDTRIKPAMYQKMQKYVM